MVYLPPGLRRAMSVLAAERGCRISDLYAEAVGGYLQSWRRPAGATPAVPEPASAPPFLRDDALNRILKLLDDQGGMIRDIQASTASLVPEVEARALAIVIAAVAKAGPDGLSATQVRARLDSDGFRSVKTTSVRDTLLRAGVMHCRDNRWIDRDAVL
ncbi:hypothetical protein [Methylorubrum thiocyanatum]|uniref:hypothetical protein n=1 Tax=Methylorubrum thiocyanatum TaxID=47958 RepID=UPI00398C668D